MKAGELVVLVNDVQGVAAGKEGRVMSVREDAVLVECRLEQQRHFVLARTWDLLPETIYRRSLKRQRKHLSERKASAGTGGGRD